MVSILNISIFIFLLQDLLKFLYHTRKITQIEKICHVHCTVAVYEANLYKVWTQFCMD